MEVVADQKENYNFTFSSESMRKLISPNIFHKIKNHLIHSWFKSIGLFKQEEDKFPDAIKYEAR